MCTRVREGGEGGGDILNLTRVNHTNHSHSHTSTHTTPLCVGLLLNTQQKLKLWFYKLLMREKGCNLTHPHTILHTLFYTHYFTHIILHTLFYAHYFTHIILHTILHTLFYTQFYTHTSHTYLTHNF